MAGSLYNIKKAILPISPLELSGTDSVTERNEPDLRPVFPHTEGNILLAM